MSGVLSRCRIYSGAKPYKPLVRHLTRVKPLTCIIGVKCADGVQIVADRRIVRGGERREEEKIFEPFAGVVVSAAGWTGIIDKFKKQVVESARLSRVQDLDEAIVVIEDVAAELKKRYAGRLPEGEKGFIEALIGGLQNFTSGEAELHHLLSEGYAEIIKDYLPIGSGGTIATTFVKAMYHKDITMSEMGEIAVFPIILIQELELDDSVGGKPQVFRIKDRTTETERDINNIVEKLTDKQVDGIIEKVKPKVDSLRRFLKS